MRIMISAGGTGGGVYPAFATAEALKGDNFTPVDLIFIGGIGKGGMEPELLTRSGTEWAASAMISGGPVHGVNPLELVWSLIKLFIGLLQALGLMLKHRPNSAFITGGWASLPVALAAWVCRVPVYSFVPDIEPALTLKVTGRFTRKVAATTAETAAYFKSGQVVETGYPLRSNILQATREEAMPHFGLDATKKTLLITGGSSGARTINRAIISILPQLLDDDSLQIIHLTGHLDWDEVNAAREALPAATQARYHAYDYLHNDMGLAYAAADLVVARAGASTLGEFPVFGLPAILVPYPFAWRYQKVNADYLAKRGAAIRLDDETMPELLYSTIRDVLDSPQTLEAMKRQASALARRDGAQQIAQLLIQENVR